MAFCGGAHPNLIDEDYVFDLADGTQLSSLGFHLFGKVFQLIGKGQIVLETATLHDTTWCLRALTVGFALSDSYTPTTSYS